MSKGSFPKGVDPLSLSDLLLLFEMSDFLNIILIIITIVTVRYASKTLLMEYSTQILISRYRLKVEEKEEMTHTWQVDIENKGRGYVVKGFILLSFQSAQGFGRRQYHLSKPITDIDPGEKDVIALALKESHFGGFMPDVHQVKIEVYYQDALNKIYLVTPGADETNTHMQKFDRLPKKVTFLTPRYFLYIYKFNKAIKQENTHIDRKNIEIANKT